MFNKQLDNLPLEAPVYKRKIHKSKKETYKENTEDLTTKNEIHLTEQKVPSDENLKNEKLIDQNDYSNANNSMNPNTISENTKFNCISCGRNDLKFIQKFPCKCQNISICFNCYRRINISEICTFCNQIIQDKSQFLQQYYEFQKNKTKNDQLISPAKIIDKYYK